MGLAVVHAGIARGRHGESRRGDREVCRGRAAQIVRALRDLQLHGVAARVRGRRGYVVAAALNGVGDRLGAVAGIAADNRRVRALAVDPAREADGRRDGRAVDVHRHVNIAEHVVVVCIAGGEAGLEAVRSRVADALRAVLPAPARGQRHRGERIAVGGGQAGRRGLARVGLVDRHGQLSGGLRMGLRLRRRDNDGGRAGLYDGQRAGLGVHADRVLAAGLDGVADCAAARRRVGHAGADALARVAVGKRHIFRADRLGQLVGDGHGDRCCGACVVIGVGRYRDIHGHAAGILAGGQDAAAERAARRVVAEFIADSARRAVHRDVGGQIEGVPALDDGRGARDVRGVRRLFDVHSHVNTVHRIVVRRIRRRIVCREAVRSRVADALRAVRPAPALGQRHRGERIAVGGGQAAGHGIARVGLADCHS